MSLGKTPLSNCDCGPFIADRVVKTPPMILRSPTPLCCAHAVGLAQKCNPGMRAREFHSEMRGRRKHQFPFTIVSVTGRPNDPDGVGGNEGRSSIDSAPGPAAIHSRQCSTPQSVRMD